MGQRPRGSRRRLRADRPAPSPHQLAGRPRRGGLRPGRPPRPLARLPWWRLSLPRDGVRVRARRLHLGVLPDGDRRCRRGRIPRPRRHQRDGHPPRPEHLQHDSGRRERSRRRLPLRVERDQVRDEEDVANALASASVRSRPLRGRNGSLPSRRGRRALLPVGSGRPQGRGRSSCWRTCGRSLANRVVGGPTDDVLPGDARRWAAKGGVSFAERPLGSGVSASAVVGWLRETGGDRSNLAVLNLGGEKEGEVVVRVTLVPAGGGGRIVRGPGPGGSTSGTSVRALGAMNAGWSACRAGLGHRALLRVRRRERRGNGRRFVRPRFRDRPTPPRRRFPDEDERASRPEERPRRDEHDVHREAGRGAPSSSPTP